MRPEVPHGLAEIILEKMMAKRPDDRYQSMADVEAALETFITRGDGTPLPMRRSQPIHVVTAAPMPRPQRRAASIANAKAAKKPYVLYGITGAGVLFGAIGLFAAMHNGSRAPIAAAQPAPTLPAASVPAPREVQKVPVELEADVAGAKVTFRRRVAVTPESITISPTDVVELVEVSAPGYKTQRFWLTFDRPTHLRAHLTRGTGIAEASEEDTLVALGEIAAPKPAAPAVTTVAPKPQVAKPIVENDETVAMAPRKIGHDADAVVDEAPEAPAIDTPPTTEDAIAAPAVPQAADPSLATIEVPKAEVPAIDDATMSSVVGSHRPEVLKCLAAGKSNDKAMKGTVDLQLQVGDDGRVHRVQVQSTLKDPRVAACIIKAANAWTFPGHAGGDASVAYPFTIN
ncbi:MAG TPA: AgmX/PglI C-terminal domain-containing protein, partial [Kofleriaceae bacterium]|jgi:hypothetical protein